MHYFLLCLLLNMTVLPAFSSPRIHDAFIGKVTDLKHLPTEWNAAVLEVAEAEDGFLTLKGLRTVTMMHLAVHDAISTVEGAFAPYVFVPEHPEKFANAHVQVAATQAAYVISVSQYADKQESMQALRDSWLAGFKQDKAFRNGILLGNLAAQAVLASRESDAWDAETEYIWHPMAPGVYAEFNEHSGTPEGFIFGAGWGLARPFGMKHNDQFTVPPPPDIESSEYAHAFDEVKIMGRFQSIDRTPDQTHLALWWKDFVENSHNRLARDLIHNTPLDIQTANRLLALLNMSIYDAYVSSFYNKFLYNHWRPYTAIRWAAHDGNSATIPEKSWTNTHHHTYAFPSYPSAHGTACAAAMTVLADVFGNNYAFTMTTTKVDLAGPFSGKINMMPPIRSFESFSEAAMECTLSRVYLGIHFRYDSVQGNALGNTVGDYNVKHLLKPTRD